MIVTYKYKLYNSDKNNYLNNQIDIACYIYNHCIALYKKYYSLYHKTLTKNKLQKHLTKLKKTNRYKFFNKLNSQTIQDITDRIERSYKQFFKNLKKHRPPSFKSKKKYKSIGFKQTGYKILEDNKIKIGGKIYKYWKSKEIEGNMKRLTLKRDALGDLYIFLCVDEKRKPKASKTGKIAGCDFGLKTFLHTSDNEKIESPQYLKNNIEKLRRLSKELSKKKKGSKNWIKAKNSLNRLYRKINNQRHDFNFKLSNELIKRYDVIFFEDLNLEGMKKLWGRKISDLSFYQFLKTLEWKAKENDKEILYIDRFFPSSKMCSECGIVNAELSLKDREWQCICGKKHNRDYNASINILKAGASAYEGDKISNILLKNIKSYC